jgi:hypothetical protein
MVLDGLQHYQTSEKLGYLIFNATNADEFYDKR